MKKLLFFFLISSVSHADKVNWTAFKAIIDENQTDYYQRNDADNISYRLKTVVANTIYECNVLKSPPGNADLVDYQNNYQANAKSGGE